MKDVLFCGLIYTLTAPPSDAVRKRRKNIIEDLFSSVFSQFKKYPPSGNLKFNNSGIFQSFKFRILIKKNPSNFS